MWSATPRSTASTIASRPTCSRWVAGPLPSSCAAYTREDAMPSQARKLEAEAVRRACPPEHFDFGTTRELPSLTGVLGQPRARAALEFGAAIASHGFNLFA